MDLIISEKNIAGKRIAEILAGKKIETEIEGKTNSYKFSKDGKEFLVIPLKGHILDVDFPKQFKQWLGTDLRKLVKSEIEFIDTEPAIVSLLKKKAKEAQTVIIATDADREGEAIGVEALQIIKKVNPKIKIKRAYFSAITPKDISKAFNSLTEVDYNFADSANARREIDLIWGAVLTRFLSLISGRLGNEFISAGRVQMPSVDFYEDLIIQDKKGLISIVKIGKFVEQFKNKESESIGRCNVYKVIDKEFKALSFNQNTLKLEFKPLTHVIKHKHFGNLYEITLESGRKVKITGTHSIFTLRQGKIEIITGEELKIGSIILTPKIIEENNKISEINLLNEFIKLDRKTKKRFFISHAFKKKWIKINERGQEFLKARKKEKKLVVYKTLFASSTVSQWENGKKKKVSFEILSDYLSALDYDVESFLKEEFGKLIEPTRKVIKLSELTNLEEISLSQNSRIYSYNLTYSLPLKTKITSELMRLLGYYLAEGSFTRRSAYLDFGITEDDLAEDAVNCIKELFNIKPKKHAKKNIIHINFSGAIGKILFEKIFKIGNNARNKRLPQIVFNVSTELKKEFLKGYFEGDGNYTTSGQLCAATASKQLASELLYILNQFGIIGSIQKQLNKSSLPNEISSLPRTRYTIKISGKQNLIKLKEVIPKRYEKRLQQYLQLQNTRCGYGGIPIHETNISKIWIDLPRHYSQKISPQKLFFLIQNTNKKLSTNTIQKLTTLSETDLGFLKIINVKKVKPSTNFVYDISVQDNENFVGGFGGIVLHNTLSLIVDREKERLAFEIKKYWVLEALFEKNKKEFIAEHKEGRFWEKEKAEQILKKKTSKGIVKKVSSTKKVLKKPLPFNTTGFLRAASALGFSAGEAMNIAESLYMSGYTSYPRTDNTVYPQNLDLKEILNTLISVPEFIDSIEKIFSLGELNPSRGTETKDHPPIHPVASALKEKLSSKEWRIYELICRRFFATLGEDAETLNQSIEIELNKEPFIANGQILLKAGWKELYPYSVVKEVILPELKKGEEVNLKDLKMEEKETQPPNRYSQGKLIQLMEQLNIGTKSTRHEILNKLYARKYISGLKSIEPNKIAFAVIDSLEKHKAQINEAKLTAELEKEMDEIAAAKKSKQEIVNESREILGKIMEQLLKEKNEIGSELRQAIREDSILVECNKCKKGNLRIMHGRTGKRFIGCTNYPNCSNSFPLPQNGRIIPLNKICDQCQNIMIKVINKRPYTMCIDPKCVSKADWGKKKEETKTEEPNEEKTEIVK